MSKPEKEKKVKEPNTVAATVWTWAKALNVSEDKIGQRLSGKGIHPARGEKIPAIQVFGALNDDKDQALIRKANAEAEAIERKNKIANETFIDVEKASEIFGAKLQAIIERIDAQAAMLDAQLARETNPLTVRKILTQYNEQTKDLARRSMEKSQ